jgi:hypothetical protein
MKTLEDHILVYDSECPLCRAYTGAFVKYGLLDRNGRQAFGTQSAAVKEYIDSRRARNEIALVNSRTGEVTYGVESLMKVIWNRYPFLRPVFLFPPVLWFARKCYALVSYNRKVVVPGNVFEGDAICRPDFHPGYRLLYIVLAWIATALVLNSYSGLIGTIIPAGPWCREYLVCGGQVLYQLPLVLLLNRSRLIYYLGNMMTVSLAGALLLLPVVLVNMLVITSEWFNAGWFLLTALLMMAEHARRCRVLGLPWILTASWLLYRIILLLFLLNLTI